MKRFMLALIFGPSMLFALGYLMNALVMAANHGQMPVLYPGGGCGPADFWSDDIVHVCMNAQTHFRFLADWIPMVHRGQLDAMASPGDFLEMACEKTFTPSLFIAVGAAVKRIFFES